MCAAVAGEEMIRRQQTPNVVVIPDHVLKEKLLLLLRILLVTVLSYSNEKVRQILRTRHFLNRSFPPLRRLRRRRDEWVLAIISAL